MSGIDVGDDGATVPERPDGGESARSGRDPGPVPRSGSLAREAAMAGALVARAPHAVAVTEGPTHLLRGVSPAFCRLLGVEPAEVVDRPCASAWPDREGAGLLPLLDRVYRSGAAEPDHQVVRRRAGSTEVWSCTVWPLQDELGAITGLVVELRDRTDEAESSRRLQESAAQIRQVNERLIRTALQEQEWAETARAAARARAEFLAMMSHELRTPLGGIVSYTDILLGERQGPISTKQRDSLERISACSDHLIRMIDAVLAYARVEARSLRVRPERVDLWRLVREAAAMIEPLAAKKGLDLRIALPDESLSLETDPQMVRQILLNLLGNAVKFTDRGGVRLEARAERAEVRLRVRDTGIGIPPEDMERIFEPFVQSDAVTTRRFGGTGLGLPISRALVTLLGGSVTAESTPGEGATFTVRLPRAAASDSAAP